MPSSSVIISILELVLVLSGVVVLWRVGLSPLARARSLPPALPNWEISPLNLLIFAWCIFMGGFLAQMIILQLLKPTGGILTDTQKIFAGAGFQFGMLGGWLGARLIWPARWKGPNGPATAPMKAVPTLLGGALTFLAAMPLLVLVGLAWQNGLKLLGFPVEQQDLVGLFANADSPVLLATLIGLAIFIAPVTEELVFRAGLFRYVRGRLPRWAALLVPACLFAALHGNLASFAPLVMLGLLFSLAYERTGNIAVSMIAHSLFNLNTALLIFAGVGM